MARREKTVTRSFRISETDFLALQKEAERRGISTNTLLNLLLRSFSEYDRFLGEFHMLKLSSATFRRILQAATDETILEAGKAAGSSIPSSFAMARFGQITEEHILEYLKLMGRYANLFEFNLVERPGSRTMTLVHGLGRKGSLFLSEYTKAALEKAGTKSHVSYGDDSVTLSVVEREGPVPKES